MAPMPERNLIQDSSVPSTADPIAAPMINCAMVPTTISDSAEEIRNQIEKARDQRETQPERRQRPNFCHAALLQSTSFDARRKRPGVRAVTQ